MKAFIKSSAVISPQKTFNIRGFPEEVIDYPSVDFLKCVEPVYKDYLDPMASRRMSRIVKMGVCGAMSCLRNAEIEVPDAIIAGTGLGCIEDTEKFLGSIYANDERLMNPTPFIQSTHNTIAGAIALAIKCHGYNATYTHRGFSFESALLDSLMLVAENPNSHILTGGFDELTPNSYMITKRMGLWKTHPVSSLSLFGDAGRGTLPGEGLAFFLLGGLPGRNDLAQLLSIRTLFKPKNEKQIEDQVVDFIHAAGLSLPDIDLVILGLNGDPKSDRYYHYLMQGKLGHIPQASFKHLCGEYDTASSFALWLASAVIHEGKLPDSVRVGRKSPGAMNHVLIYNHLRGVNHSLYLLSSC
jgi:3-oxoacyl-[acyl-carrier-protein] synthase II